MSFGAGMAAGIGAGVAIGMSTGARQSRDKLARSFECQGITLLDRQGKKISLDDALVHIRCPGFLGNRIGPSSYYVRGEGSQASYGLFDPSFQKT